MTDLFERTWKQLPTDMFTSQNKGSKAEARKEWDKLKLDDATITLLTDFLTAKESIDRQRRKGTEMVPAWPHFCRMVKRRFWEDDLPTAKYKSARSTDTCECGAPIDHGGHRCCWGCYDKRFGNSLCGHA